MLTAIEKQSPDISQGVTEGEGLHKEQGAGDQGLMFGYATDETPKLMPAPIDYAHQLARSSPTIRKSEQGRLPPPRRQDPGHARVRERRARSASTRSSSRTQHDESVKYKTLREAIVELVIEKVIPKKLIDKNTKFHVNPTGRFVVGGPLGDCGLTGRKIIVDTYGGMGRHGGGAFSGKDPSKVDRSACYYARYVAKNVVAAGLAKRCEVQVAYAIGVAQPVGVYVNTFGTGKVADEKLEKYIHRELRHAPQGAHRRARSPAPHLPADRGLRSLRPHRVLVGEDRPRRQDGRRSAQAPPTAQRRPPARDWQPLPHSFRFTGRSAFTGRAQKEEKTRGDFSGFFSSDFSVNSASG